MSTVSDLAAKALEIRNAADAAASKVSFFNDQIENAIEKVTNLASTTAIKEHLEEEAKKRLTKLLLEQAPLAQVEAAQKVLTDAKELIAAAKRAEETAKNIIDKAKLLKEAALCNLQKAILDDIKMPELPDIQLPTLSWDDIKASLPSLPELPEFPPKFSINLKDLIPASFGLAGCVVTQPVIDTLKIIGLVPKDSTQGGVSGPGGNFIATQIAQKVVVTDSIHAPAGDFDTISSPTIIGGNIVSTAALNLVTPTVVTITAPTVTVTAPTSVVVVAPVVTLTSAAVSVSGTLTAATSVVSPLGTFAAVAVSGTLTAATSVVSPLGTFALLSAPYKLFDIPHPSPGKENKRLKHGSLEGPELGVYVRGKTTDGRIVLPEYWADLVDWDTITVQLTATTLHQQLYVNNIDASGVAVFGSHSAPYYYYIVAERKDVPKLEVETDA